MPVTMSRSRQEQNVIRQIAQAKLQLNTMAGQITIGNPFRRRQGQFAWFKSGMISFGLIDLVERTSHFRHDKCISVANVQKLSGSNHYLNCWETTQPNTINAALA